MLTEMELLNQFIVNNEALEILNAQFQKFNPFNVLRLSEHEIRHSNVLAWLLEPLGNHNLGDCIIKGVMSEVIASDKNDSFPITASQIKLLNVHDMQIRREWRCIDILGISELNKFILLIENKINSNEGNNQLERYAKIIEEEYPDYNVMYVYLTKNGEIASDIRYISLSHASIYKIIKLHTELHKSNLNTYVYNFINHYLEILEVITMQNEHVIKMCKEIYKNYKDAIDMIVNYGMTSELDWIFDDFKINKDIIESRRTPSEFWFLPKEITEFLPKYTRAWKSEYPVSMFFIFNKNDSSIGLYCEIGPNDNQAERQCLLKYLKENGFSKISEKAIKNVNGRYTNIFTKIKKNIDFDVEENLLEIMNQLYQDKDTCSFLNQLNLVLKEYKW